MKSSVKHAAQTRQFALPLPNHKQKGSIIMLLRHLYELAHSRKLLDDLAFTKKPIRWVISLDAEGNLLGFTPTGDDRRGKEYPVPQTSRAKNAGGVAEFLWESITGVFGLDSDPEQDIDNEKKRRDRDQNNLAKRDEFWRQIQAAFDATHHCERYSTFGRSA
jgi:hypothetical protein